MASKKTTKRRRPTLAGLRAALGRKATRRKCRQCSAPGEHMGTVFEHKRAPKSPIGFRLVPRSEPQCRHHYLEGSFGLWPARCKSKRCIETQRAKANLSLTKDDLTVWVGNAAVLSGLKHGCPWCGKPMRLLTAEESQKDNEASPYDGMSKEQFGKKT